MNSPQRSRTKATKWNLLFQSLTIVFAFVSGIVLVPLYVKNIPIPLYGAWLASGNIISWLTTIDPGISTILQQKVAASYGKRDAEDVGHLISNGLQITAGITLLLVLGGVVLTPFLKTVLTLKPDVDHILLEKAFLVAVVGTGLMIFSYSLLQINLGLLGSVGCGAVSVASSASGLIVTFVLIVSGFGIWALSLAILARGVVMITGNAAYLRWRLKKEQFLLHSDAKGAVELARLMLYTFGARISGVMAGNVDAFFVSRALGT